MVLGTVVDSNVLSYPVLVFTKDQGVVIGRGGASPQSSGEVEPPLGRWARRSLALGGRMRQNQSSVIRERSVVAFLSDRKRQRSMVISSTLLGTPVLGPRQYPSRIFSKI